MKLPVGYLIAAPEESLVWSGSRASYIGSVADASDTRPDEPILPGAASGDEARVFDEIVRKHVHLPEDVLRVDFRFGEDWTGAPAVWIVFFARDDLKPSRKKIAELQRAAQEVRSAVRKSGSERWPYIEIATE
jgi:hypothetical protein